QELRERRHVRVGEQPRQTPGLRFGGRHATPFPPPWAPAPRLPPPARTSTTLLFKVARAHAAPSPAESAHGEPRPMDRRATTVTPHAAARPTPPGRRRSSPGTGPPTPGPHRRPPSTPSCGACRPPL